MKRREFIDAVYAAGWRNVQDAQHSDIGKLWEKLFPTVALMEQELEEVLEELRLEQERGSGS